MKTLYILLMMLMLTNPIGAFTYMGNNTLLVTNTSGYVTTLQHNDSMNMSNSTYHLKLEAPSQDIDVAMVSDFATKFVYQILFGVVISLAVFYFIYRTAMGYA